MPGLNEQNSPPLTASEAAAKLDGCQYRDEGSRALFSHMRASALVAVYGASDDLVMLSGAINDELGASTIHLGQKGLIRNRCEEERCPYHAEELKGAATIEPLFAENGVTWSYRTAIPHETFRVMEDDEIYCQGIVFALSDIHQAMVKA